MEPAENTFVNGQTVLSYEEEEESADGFFFVKTLEDMDRIIFGTSTTFLVRIPKEGELSEEVLNGKTVDWEFC